MSLFKTRCFWRVASENLDENHNHSLLTTNLDIDFDYLITSSENGTIRIYKPTENLYKPTDLFLEQMLDEPILQITTGRLVSGSLNHQLAILHPKKISVYSLITKPGAIDHGIQYSLQMHYEHKLRHSAYNFVVGSFGGTQNRDFICVQSLDGILTFFEQEIAVFSCFLPNFLYPFPLIYTKKADSFVTLNSNWYLVSYRYKELSEIGEKSRDSDTGRKVNYEWCYNIGEAIIDLDVIEVGKISILMVLGEKNLFSLHDDGRINFMKKLDFAPICFTNYYLNDKSISLIIAETSTLLIYENTTLKWSAQLEFTPISIKRASLKDLSGILVFMDAQGGVECNYLGTEPNLFVAPPLKYQDLNFDEVEKELGTLTTIIKNAKYRDDKLMNTTVENELNLEIHVNPHLELHEPTDNFKCLVDISVTPKVQLDEFQMSFHVEYPLKIEPSNFFAENLTDNQKINCEIFLVENLDIPSLELNVMATYISLGQARNLEKSTLLPLKLIVEVCKAVKENEHKITLNINESPMNLTQLFPEFAGGSFTPTSNAVGFKITEDKIVSVLLAKNSDRYRIQSDSFTSLTLIVQQMIVRLKKECTNKNCFQITYQPPLPIEDSSVFLENYFKACREYDDLEVELTQLMTQFRLIQKKLMAKYKTKNPNPLDNLAFLLEDTHKDIVKTIGMQDEQSRNLRKNRTELACVLKLIILLAGLMDIDGGLLKVIGSIFVLDIEGQDWFDLTDVSLCNLLKTSLAKNEKDQLKTTSFDGVKDLSKFKKHFFQVLERISKGYKIDDNPPNIEELQQPLDEEKPIGKQIAESSTRLLSARARQKCET